ncbi:hypothetical protein AGR2A_Cc10269 [Agrobacterium genomosp. 2 str. CFBP 5494]|uniref:Uncharacterized protein n=1 Tax=Agrobacterium genomosp. 2 str. CFBP 5494 TaxID=1183436 RepID=A0A9W5F0H3_9HYPH|nr:hypothetical protein AGR2A_Cc10269 [Agrobacterium genomosp. 2 str. CFBP 5494]
MRTGTDRLFDVID